MVASDSSLHMIVWLTLVYILGCVTRFNESWMLYLLQEVDGVECRFPVVTYNLGVHTQ